MKEMYSWYKVVGMSYKLVSMSNFAGTTLSNQAIYGTQIASSLTQLFDGATTAQADLENASDYRDMRLDSQKPISGYKNINKFQKGIYSGWQTTGASYSGASISYPNALACTYLRTIATYPTGAVLGKLVVSYYFKFKGKVRTS